MINPLLLLYAVLALPALVNPGFEANEPRAGWSLHVYGAQPEVAADRTEHHGGAQSLRVSSAEPSDTALSQDVQLTPGAWYRLRGWVRTRDLDPHGSPVYGTFQIQRAGGGGPIATGANHRGDTVWTEVPVVFRAPADGRVQITLFFVGFGKGTGAAWFDDVSLDEVPVATSPIKVTRRPLVDADISPLQYGQFIEYLANLVGGMWAEKLYDNSFEGLSPYNVAFLRETDFREKPWHPCGQTNRAEYVRDEATRVSGKVSQRVRVAGGAPCEVGIAQDGVFANPATADTFSCWLRQAGLTGPVTVRVHGEARDLRAGRVPRWRRVAQVHGEARVEGPGCQCDALDRVPRSRHALDRQRLAHAR